MNSKSSTSSSTSNIDGRSPVDLRDFSETDRLCLVKYCFRFTKDRDNAEDLAHSAILKALRSNYTGRCARFTWLCLIAKTLFFTSIRQKREVIELEEIFGLESDDRSPFENFANSELQTAIKAHVEVLTDEQKAVIFEQILEGYSLQEMSVRQHRSVPALKMIGFRARRTLRTSLACYAGI